MKQRRYYAAYNFLGIEYDYKQEYYIFYVFDSKAERDSWVLASEWEDGKYVATDVTRRDVERAKGKNFVIAFDAESGDTVAISQSDFYRNSRYQEITE
ncbi:hypothetical protein [Megasphaera massiliensis]|jgi:hypothetical protein|uniref:hypothetical protein n=1 Tax=Megasphaera massiliensis TaxID=1232428 RepID=UPI0020698259|nr:MAG TPA: hypothetical protein [Bacteriophage sp.]